MKIASCWLLHMIQDSGVAGESVHQRGGVCGTPSRDAFEGYFTMVLNPGRNYEFEKMILLSKN